jgi:hypothetical protein
MTREMSQLWLPMLCPPLLFSVHPAQYEVLTHVMFTHYTDLREFLLGFHVKYAKETLYFLLSQSK